MTGNFLFLFVTLYRKMSGFPLVYLAKGFAKVMLATSIMVSWVLLLDHFFGVRASCGSILGDIFVLAGCILSGAIVYGGVLYKINLPELLMIVSRLKERIAG